MFGCEKKKTRISRLRVSFSSTTLWRFAVRAFLRSSVQLPRSGLQHFLRNGELTANPLYVPSITEIYIFQPDAWPRSLAKLQIFNNESEIKETILSVNCRRKAMARTAQAQEARAWGFAVGTTENPKKKTEFF